MEQSDKSIERRLRCAVLNQMFCSDGKIDVCLEKLIQMYMSSQGFNVTWTDKREYHDKFPFDGLGLCHCEQALDWFRRYPDRLHDNPSDLTEALSKELRVPVTPAAVTRLVQEFTTVSSCS